MEQPTPSKSLSQCMYDSQQQRKRRETERFYELEELILDTSALDPKFQEYVSEYNNLKTRV